MLDLDEAQFRHRTIVLPHERLIADIDVVAWGLIGSGSELNHAFIILLDKVVVIKRTVHKANVLVSIELVDLVAQVEPDKRVDPHRVLVKEPHIAM